MCPFLSPEWTMDTHCDELRDRSNVERTVPQLSIGRDENNKSAKD